MLSIRPRPALALLVVLQVAVSAASLVVEIVAGRMLAPYVGMSVYTWTSVIAVVLAGFSLGHWWGGRIAGFAQSRALWWTGWIMLAAALATSGAMFALRQIAPPILGTITDPVWSISLLALGAFFLPSLFAGVPAPVFACIAISEEPNTSGRALGALFAAGAVGAIFGTLLAGFAFIPWLGTTWSLGIVSLAYIATASVLLGISGTRSRRTIPAVFAGLASVLAVSSMAQSSTCTRESQYFCIRVIDVSADPASPVRRLVLDHLSHGSSARDLPRVMFTEFTAMIDAIARGRMGERKFSSFFIGGGAYSVPRAWRDRKTGPISVAEIDPEVTRVAKEHFWLNPAGMTILHQDARLALRQRTEVRYDVIVGDAFGDITVPAHLITREFFELVHARLKAGGVFLMNLIDFPDRLQALATITTTLKTTFPSVEVWTNTDLPKPGEQRVFVLVAADTPTSFSSITAATPALKRFAALEDNFIESVQTRTDSIVLTDNYVPIDRLLIGGR